MACLINWLYPYQLPSQTTTPCTGTT